MDPDQVGDSSKRPDRAGDSSKRPDRTPVLLVTNDEPRGLTPLEIDAVAPGLVPCMVRTAVGALRRPSKDDPLPVSSRFWDAVEELGAGSATASVLARRLVPIGGAGQSTIALLLERGVFCLADAEHEIEVEIENLRTGSVTWLKAEPTRVLLATLTLAGLRIGEAINLRWRDVDLATGKLRVTQSKTDAGWRTIDLSPVLRDELAAHRAGAPYAAPADRVFPHGRTAALLAYQAFVQEASPDKIWEPQTASGQRLPKLKNRFTAAEELRRMVASRCAAGNAAAGDDCPVELDYAKRGDRLLCEEHKTHDRATSERRIRERVQELLKAAFPLADQAAG